MSEYKKDDDATATMLAFNRQAEAASKEGLKCGCTPVYLPRDPSVAPTQSGTECAALCVVPPTLAGGPVVTAVQPAAVQPAAPDLQWVQCEDCEKWRKLALGAPAWEGDFKCKMNDWNPESASCDAKEDSDEEVGDAVLPAVLPVVPSAIKNHQCYLCNKNFARSSHLSRHLTNRVCTRSLHIQRAGAMPRVYAPVSNTNARYGGGFNITLQTLVERESAMVHLSSKSVIIKRGRRINWQNAELRALFFMLLLPYCRT